MTIIEYKLLITTSGIGNRLGELTKYTNKSLVKVGKKPSISYIVEKYPENIEIVVTLGYFGGQVKEFLELVYPERKFTFVDVNNYEEPGSSLLYSMLCAKNYLQCPFIFHACDSIIISEEIPSPMQNWLGGFPKTNSSQYRTYNTENESVTKLNEKGELHYDFEYIGLCGVSNYESFWKYAEEIYNNNPNNNSLSDCHVIQKLLINETFKSNIFSSWMDIGNMSSLQTARETIYDKFEILDKLDESIFIFDDFVIKFFYDQNIVKNRVERAKYLAPYVPYMLGVGNNFYKYEYVKGSLFSQSVNEEKFSTFLNWSKANLWTKVIINDFNKLCYDFYFEKTKNRINKFLSNNNIIDKPQFINGTFVPSISDLLKSIDIENLCDGLPVRFHGDFILDNILETANGFTLLDWRQDFGGSVEGGDLYYDLSKLNHNLIINHDIVNKKLYEVSIDGNNINCDILRNHKLVQCQGLLKQYIINNKLDLNKVNILTALIWLNMSPLHDYHFGQFLFYFGKYNIHKALGVSNE